MSITDHKPETYARNLTLRYPIYIPFDGDKLRITFDNYCGTEDIKIAGATVLKDGVFKDITFNNGDKSVRICAKEQVISDEIEMNISANDTIYVSFYLDDFTLMRSSVVATGPLSKGIYAVGDYTHQEDIPIKVSRRTEIFYFLSNISIHTCPDNHAIVCYGDSITAEEWPDFLKLKLKDEGIQNVSVIRRAASGTRILREYDNITYESYGLKGTNRFEHEVPTDGADIVIIQQGINDIIHPVGEDINPFRPMSDLPTVDELSDGYRWYVTKAREYGYKIYAGTLLPIEGWRTYEEFREVMKNDFNDWIRNEDIFDGVIDFHKALEHPDNCKAFAEGFDSGDHLHPSAAGYKMMAEAAFEILAADHVF